MIKSYSRKGMVWVAAALVWFLSGSNAVTQPSDQVPDELEGVGITERTNERIPLDLEFKDSEGKDVALRELFNGKKPVILNLGYFRCPMLCGLVSNGMMASAKELEWSIGEEFDIVTVSIDPLETPALAKLKKQTYLKEYGRSSASSGWHFLTGKERDIQVLTDAVGFHYKWNEQRQEFAHAAVIVLCSPDGTIARYLYGIQFEPKTLRLSLAEASEGKVGSTLDRVLLFCFHYDPKEGSYALAAMNLMRFGGIVTVLILGSVMLFFWRRELRRKTTIQTGTQS